jgi:hypothetical protein
MNNENTHKVGSYSQAIVVALILGALTIVELAIALYMNSPVLLLLIAAIKAVLVIRFFMHINRLWAPEGEH